MTQLYDEVRETSEFDIEQVYGSPSPHNVIRASAGSGKTYQLTTRYLRLLRHHAAPESMLATTFTRKAAGEILARVLGRLARAAMDGNQREALSAALEGEPLEPADCKAMLGRLVRSLDRMAISTIDSFFNRIAQGFRYELDLPVNPQLVDASHPLATQLRAQAIEALLADDDLATMLTLLRRLHHDTADRSVTQAIDAIVCNHYEVYRQAPQRDLWSTVTAPGLLDDAQVEQAIEALEAMEPVLPLTKTGDLRKSWANGFARDLHAARVGNWETFLDKGVPAKLAAGEASFDSVVIDGAWAAVYEPLVRHASATQVMVVARQTEATFDLLDRFDTHYERLRRRHRLLLFSDLTHKLARLLPSLGDEVLADVYYRLDERVSHLLLDEFQDTSVDQWSVLAPFAQEVTSHADGSRSLFCVGDVKQAIYGWRGGCADLFDHVEAMVGGAQGLAKSWRSSQVVLDAVNEVFGTIADNVALQGTGDAATRWANSFERHEAMKAMPGFVELVTSYPEVQPQTAARDEEEQEEETFGSHEAFAARRVQAIHEAAPGRTIGVLMTTNKMVNLMLYELRRRGLPVSGEAGNPVTDAPAVSAVLAALTLADHPGHTAAAFHVLNSPMGEVVGLHSLAPHETARVAIEIRRSLLMRGYAGTLTRWVQALAPSCNERNLVRLTQLVELAERYEPMETLRPSRFVTFVEATPVDEPAPAPIRVMTIHASKGLEFDAVVLPQLNGRLKKSPALLVDRDAPTAPIRAVYRCPAERVRQRMPQVEQAFDAYQQAERQDDLCSLYVAMTRAKHALHMVIKPLSRTKSGIGTCGWTNLSFATMLRRSLSTKEEGFDGGEVLYEQGCARWAGEAAGEVDAQPQAAEPLRVTLAPPADGARRGWASVTPSSLHGGGRFRAMDLLRLDEGQGVVAGRIIHRWLESVGFVDEMQAVADDEALLYAAALEGADPAQAADLVARFRAMLAQPQVRAVLSRGGATELWRERNFAVRLGGRLLHGQFDRVAIRRDPQGVAQHAVLIDFKTDRVEDDALATRMEHYRPQLEAYRSALSRMLGLDPAQIETKAVFLHSGTVRTL